MATDRVSEPSTERLRRYFDQNTRRFERHGQGGSSIHRAVWGPGVTTRGAAFHYVDDLILDELHDSGIPTVLDLGCGLCSTLLYLASRREIRGEGITISPVQVARANELIAASNMSSRVHCREGDFLALPANLREVDLAFSIEAFVLSPDASGYFREASAALRRGGKLVICDDFLASRPASDNSPRQHRWIEEFRKGWHVGSLVTVEQASEIGESVQLRLVRDLDLTPYLELRRLRDRLLAVWVSVGRRLRVTGEYWNALAGGEALQQALVSGALSYRFLVFERS